MITNIKQVLSIDLLFEKRNKQAHMYGILIYWKKIDRKEIDKIKGMN